MNIYTTPVLLDGHVQHTDKLARTHMSVSIKYGFKQVSVQQIVFQFLQHVQAILSGIHSQVVHVRSQLQPAAFKIYSVPDSTRNGTRYSANQMG